MRPNESPDNRTIPVYDNSAQVAARGRGLAKEVSKKLRSGDMYGCMDRYSSLWKLFFENENHMALAESLGDATRDMGLYHIKRSDYHQLTSCVKELSELSNRFLDSASLVGNYLILLTGALDFRRRLEKYNHAQDLIPEILKLSRRFPDNEELMARFSACMESLLSLCSHGGTPSDVLTPLSNRLAEIAPYDPKVF